MAASGNSIGRATQRDAIQKSHNPKPLAHVTATGLACVRGLSVKWRSHSSAACRRVEQAYGRVSPRTSALHVGHLAGALVAGLTGFAFGLVAASIWLYILTPLQTATLIIAYGLIVQGYSVWKLRRALDWKKLRPFLLGAALGVPVGVGILTWASPAHVRAGVGVFLVLYSLYALFRPALAPIKRGGAAADSLIGFLNGVLGGITG